ncbi:MAG TPA: penicillin acylase family protein, partial [Telluria sp.]|nr:penicillin acylase family protein [Telluria sp.]
MQARRWKTWTLRIGAGLLALTGSAALGVWLFLRASLPQLDGTVHADGMNSTVTVERDARGVPLIRGRNRLDIAYVTGYLHAQERFFQMDLMRRVAAGELSELFGPKALEMDREHRLHRFRARAERILANMDPDERQFLDRYVAGVNEGLNALGARPFEYGLLGTRPRAWMPADSLLVAWTMYFDLQGKTELRELARGWVREHTTADQLAFLLPESTHWDATLDLDAPAVPESPIPARAPSWWGKGVPGSAPLAALEDQWAADIGSNNWALGGRRTANGSAIVSNDMHLSIKLPNTWYRAALLYPDEQGHPRRVVGLTLPGAPLVLVGSNGQVAWGFTNSYGDYLDLIEAERDPARPGEVRVDANWEPLRTVRETIFVKGQAPVQMLVHETSLGPLRKAGNRQYAIHWTAHAADTLNFRARLLETAPDVSSALRIANTLGIPAQNFVAGDADGNIGWTIAGPLPKRGRYDTDTTFPLMPGAPEGWSGRLEPEAYPRVINPPTGQL